VLEQLSLYYHEVLLLHLLPSSALNLIDQRLQLLRPQRMAALRLQPRLELHMIARTFASSTSAIAAI
jgi:hypothetical protein